jgi:hypothetical protein
LPWIQSKHFTNPLSTQSAYIHIYIFYFVFQLAYNLCASCPRSSLISLLLLHLPSRSSCLPMSNEASSFGLYHVDSDDDTTRLPSCPSLSTSPATSPDDSDDPATPRTADFVAEQMQPNFFRAPSWTHHRTTLAPVQPARPRRRLRDDDLWPSSVPLDMVHVFRAFASSEASISRAYSPHVPCISDGALTTCANLGHGPRQAQEQWRRRGEGGRRKRRRR